MHWLDKVPFWPLAVVALFMGLAPFSPEPHLWEKTKMLLAGNLVRPLDIFDLLWHGFPATLLLLKVVRLLFH
jgi:hypothetical protein